MSCHDALLWVTDPWDTLDHPRDTTLRLVQECAALGIPCFWSDVTSVRWTPQGTRLEVFQVQRVSPARDAHSFVMRHRGDLSPADFGMLLYRPDPPVDLAYLHPLQLIVRELEQRTGSVAGPSTELVNPARVLLSCGEKTEAGWVDGLAAPSLVATRWETLQQFGAAEGKTVVKPLHQAQSLGVQLLDWRDDAGRRACHLALEGLTGGFRRPVMLQRYLDEVLDGETRLWLVDGELVAAARKIPAQGTFRIDMDKGGALARHDLTDREQDSLRRVGTHLVRAGIRMAAVDMIAGYVTDFNFTSPGLLPAMEAIDGRNLAEAVMRRLLARHPTLAERSERARPPIALSASAMMR